MDIFAFDWPMGDLDNPLLYDAFETINTQFLKLSDDTDS